MAACVYPVAQPSASKPPFTNHRGVRRFVTAMVLALIVTVFLAAEGAHAAGPSIETTWRVGSPAAKPGTVELVLTVILEKGWHVNANDPDRPYLIPTTLEIEAPATIGVESIRYPEAVVHGLAFAPGTPLRLYEGTFAIRVRMAGAAPSRFDAKLAFQACNDETCLPPRTLPVPFDAARVGSR